jgi:hypothetical protein
LAVTLPYPIDINREIDRKWRRRSDAAPVRARVPLEHNLAAGERCPLCHAAAPIAPIASGYLGAGLIHHHWLCAPCGHAWTTAVRMPS